jgi:hypothetical protein
VQDLVIPKDVTAVQLVAATPMAKPAGLRSPW